MGALRIERLKERTTVLGPGSRAVIWTHGCSLNCPHCIAKEMNDGAEEQLFSASELYDWVKSIDGIEGITLSGGDPFEQDLDELTAFLRLVKSDPRDLSVMCYTGRLLADWQQSAAARAALALIDILVDAPYVHELNDGHLWKGSANQRIYALTERYREEVAAAENSFSREIEVNLSEKMWLEITGIPPDGFMDNLRKKLGKKGLGLSY